MAKIVRTEPGAILSKAVEYHGFVYLPGITEWSFRLTAGHTLSLIAAAKRSS